MPPTRRSPPMKRSPNHAEIMTPAWRSFNTSVPPPEDDQLISSDDTDEEAYLRMHHPEALDERESWAGPKSAAAKSEKKTGAKRTRPMKPMFPTPQECFNNIVNGWRSYESHAHNSRHRPTHSSLAKRRALAVFEPVVSAFSHIEEQLRQQSRVLNTVKARLEQNRNARGGLNERKERRNGYAQDTTLAQVTFELQLEQDSRIVNGRNGITNGVHAGSVVSADVAAVEITENAVQALREVETMFQERSRALLNVLQGIARQAQCHLRGVESFALLKQDFLASCNQGGMKPDSDDDSGYGSEVSLGKCIREQIDATKFPVLAHNFQLRQGYRLDGAITDDEEVRADGTNPGLRENTENRHMMNGHARNNGHVATHKEEQQQYYAQEADRRWNLQTANASDRVRFRASAGEQVKREPASPEPHTLNAEPQQEEAVEMRDIPNARSSKRERRSYRIVDEQIDSVASDRSDDPQHVPSSFARIHHPSQPSQPQPLRRAPPRRFQYVYDVDGNDMLDVAGTREVESDDNAGSDYYPVVVNLDSDH